MNGKLGVMNAEDHAAHCRMARETIITNCGILDDEHSQRFKKTQSCQNGGLGRLDGDNVQESGIPAI